MPRRALLIGIDKYDHIISLTGAVKDATAMSEVLTENEDGSPNYDCRLYTSPGSEPISRAFLRKSLDALFDNFAGDVLFYFAGHGATSDIGGFLVTQDGQEGDLGIQMTELLDRANGSKAEEVLLILDCCYSGSLGNPASVQGDMEKKAVLSEGVTILAATRPTEPAVEFGGHGVFTSLVLNALYGGAADVLGNVSAASIYAYAEQALGSWDERPMYKSHASKLSPVRKCEPEVPLPLLRRLPDLFRDPTATFPLDPTYEFSHADKIDVHVEIFDCFKLLRDARLLRTANKEVDRGDLYHAALRSTGARLTGLGRFYWRLAKDKRI